MTKLEQRLKEMLDRYKRRDENGALIGASLSAYAEGQSDAADELIQLIDDHSDSIRKECLSTATAVFDNWYAVEDLRVKKAHQFNNLVVFNEAIANQKRATQARGAIVGAFYCKWPQLKEQGD